MINIEKFLEKYIKPDEKIILACSAWPDSIYLLYKILETKYRKSLVVCYFNHKTRPWTEIEENFIKEWNKIKEASIFFNKPKDTSSITMCCLGKQKTAFGFKWKYKNEILKRNE